MSMVSRTLTSKSTFLLTRPLSWMTKQYFSKSRHQLVLIWYENVFKRVWYPTSWHVLWCYISRPAYRWFVSDNTIHALFLSASKWIISDWIDEHTYFTIRFSFFTMSIFCLNNLHINYSPVSQEISDLIMMILWILLVTNELS
jgi:hypothetical protein